MKKIKKPSPEGLKKAIEIVESLTKTPPDVFFDKIEETKKEIKISHESPHRLLLDIGGECFSVSVSNYNEITIRSLEDTLVVLPQASNSIVIKTKKEMLHD